MIETFSFKKDKFRINRGDYSRLLNVCCRKCNDLILIYQKDGPGNLRRLYFDRIFGPSKLVHLENKSLKNISSLVCKKCGEILGTPYVYKKEKRNAFHLYQDAVIKKIRKLR